MSNPMYFSMLLPNFSLIWALPGNYRFSSVATEKHGHKLSRDLTILLKMYSNKNVLNSVLTADLNSDIPKSRPLNLKA